MTTLEKLQQDGRDRFNALELVYDACKKCDGLGVIISALSTATHRTCERCGGNGNEKDEFDTVQTSINQLIATAYHAGVQDAMNVVEKTLGSKCDTYEKDCATCEVWEALSTLTTK